MRDVRNKFLAAFVERPHPYEDPVERRNDLLRLIVGRLRHKLGGTALPDVADVLRKPPERPYEESRKDQCERKIQQHQNNHDKARDPVQDLHRCHDRIRRDRRHENAAYHLIRIRRGKVIHVLERRRLGDRRDDLDITVVLVVGTGRAVFTGPEALDDVPGNDGFTGGDIVRIADDAQVRIHDEDPPVVQCREEVELRVDGIDVRIR